MVAEMDHVSQLLAFAEESIGFLYHTLVEMHIKETVATSRAHSVWVRVSRGSRLLVAKGPDEEPRYF